MRHKSDIDVRIATLAGRQGGVVSAKQLLALGLDRLEQLRFQPYALGQNGTQATELHQSLVGIGRPRTFSVA